MPTKRRPLAHARIGGVRVTERLLKIYRAWQDELRRDRRSPRAHDLGADLWVALGHRPWDDLTALHAKYEELHQLAYEDPRPKRVPAI